MSLLLLEWLVLLVIGAGAATLSYSVYLKG